jgi:hypothetical protein
MNPLLLSKLKKINFLDIDFNFNFLKLKEEVLNSRFWYDHYVPPQYYFVKDSPPEIHKNYKQCAILTYDPRKSSKCLTEYFAWKDNSGNIRYYYDYNLDDRKYYFTEVADEYPYLKQLILEISDRPILCKIVKSSPGHGLGWHSHQNDPEFPKLNRPEQCILHIPIIQDENVAFMVRDDLPENRMFFDTLENYKKMNNIDIGSFLPGKIYFFNGYKVHAYKNYSKNERIDILLYNDIDHNKKLESLLEKSIKELENV